MVIYTTVDDDVAHCRYFGWLQEVGHKTVGTTVYMRLVGSLGKCKCTFKLKVFKMIMLA